MLQIKGKHWKSLKKFSIFIKIILAFLILVITYNILKTEDPNFKELAESFAEIKANQSKMITLLVIIFLMPINWLIESYKWKLAIKNIIQISLSNAIMGTLCGLSIGNLMPNRTGEFIGKVIYLPFGYRLKGTVASIFTSIAQFTVTIFFGAISFALVTLFFLSFPFKSYVAALNIFIAVLCVFIYFNIGLISNLKFKNKLVKKGLKYLKVLKIYNTREKLKILGLSVLRYFIFSCQFIGILWVLSSTINVKTVLFVPISFYFNTIIPSFTFGELGLRELINLKLSDSFMFFNTSAVLAGFLLWLLNVLIPSIFGVLFLFRAKLFPK